MSSKKLKPVIYHDQRETVDFQTGELVKKESHKVVKKPSTPDFIMLFTKTAPYLAEAKLTQAASSVLWAILSGDFVKPGNFVDLSPAARRRISELTNLKRNTVNAIISTLLKKKILIRDTKDGTIPVRSADVYLNPHIFGKGFWPDIERLRYEVSVDFDFKKLEATTETSIKTYYRDEDLENGKQIKVVGAEEYIDEDGTINRDVYVETVDEEAAVADTSAETTVPLLENNRNEAIEDIRQRVNEKTGGDEQVSDDLAELKRLELENKQKQLQIEYLKALIEAKKLGIDVDELNQ
ncbi:MAG: hypothetical protein GXO16_05855 [Epsilonproteobacteria bacterium]|nr:hypothetical protein [Campylobacterota bacterium]